MENMSCKACGAAVDDYGRYIPQKQPDGFTAPSIATDAFVLRRMEEGYELLLIRRGCNPDQGCLALPGGFVEYGENPESSVLRELVEETGLRGVNPRPIGVAGNPLRDPRKHVISVIYLVEVPVVNDAVAGDDAAEIVWTRIGTLPLVNDEVWAFDHGSITHDALQHPLVIEMMNDK